MPRGNGIIVSTDPKGVFRSCKIDGTPKPGTIMTIKPGTTVDDNGNFEMEAAGASAGLMAADGDRIPIAVLLEDSKQGKTTADAYADGAIAEVYYPAVGEELNVLFGNQIGTADDAVAGTTYLVVDDGTGLVQPTAAQAEDSLPFLALENITDPTADQLVWVLVTGQ
jgi:hypothetical protein